MPIYKRIAYGLLMHGRRLREPPILDARSAVDTDSECRRSCLELCQKFRLCIHLWPMISDQLKGLVQRPAKLGHKVGSARHRCARATEIRMDEHPRALCPGAIDKLDESGNAESAPVEELRAWRVRPAQGQVLNPDAR